MSNLNKGQETKSKIIKTAKELFYQQGYHNTTSRQISENRGTNLGLIKYYFNGKNEIAQLIYFDIRDKLDQLLISAEFPQTSKIKESVDLFLLSSAIELYLCLENKNYARFYNDIISDSMIRANILNVISEALIKFSKRQEDSAYVKMASISISAIKPALVSYYYTAQQPIETDRCIKYYLEQQLHFLGEDIAKVDELIGIMNKYHINIVEMFEPVLIKISN